MKLLKSLVLVSALGASAAFAIEPMISESTATASAQSHFPGLRAIMSPEEFDHVGLDLLKPQDIAKIDAAISRHYAANAAAGSSQRNLDRQQRYVERFGLPEFVLEEWRDMPPLRSRCVEMTGGNSFRLENGQVWQGAEPIPYKLPNHDVEISARPGGHFDLFVDGANTTIRVRRIH